MAAAGMEVRAATARTTERAARIRARPVPAPARFPARSATAAAAAAPAAAPRQVLARTPQGPDRHLRPRGADHRHRGGELGRIVAKPWHDGRPDDDCFSDGRGSAKSASRAGWDGRSEYTSEECADDCGHVAGPGTTGASADDARGGSRAPGSRAPGFRGAGQLPSADQRGQLLRARRVLPRCRPRRFRCGRRRQGNNLRGQRRLALGAGLTDRAGTGAACYEKTFTYWTSSVAGPDGHSGLFGSLPFGPEIPKLR
jgi:hypothetical protein